MLNTYTPLLVRKNFFTHISFSKFIFDRLLTFFLLPTQVTKTALSKMPIQLNYLSEKPCFSALLSPSKFAKTQLHSGISINRQQLILLCMVRHFVQMVKKKH